jgi:hypothetical protein
MRLTNVGGWFWWPANDINIECRPRDVARAKSPSLDRHIFGSDRLRVNPIEQGNGSSRKDAGGNIPRFGSLLGRLRNDSNGS